MILTEEEAKTKACCGPIGLINAVLVAAASQDGSSFTLAPGVVDAGACIGVACMAWRWEGSSQFGIRKGYCGLAGKP